MNANELLQLAQSHLTTYLEKDVLPIIVAIADPERIKIGISIQRNYPLTMIERSYGIPFGRFRSDAARLLSDPEELHGYKWSIETHEAVFGADAATEEHLKHGRHRRVPIELSTGLGNVLQNLRSLAYVDRTPYMVVGERPDHPPPYACLVEYSDESKTPGSVGVELLLFNELGGCQKVDKTTYFDEPIRATRESQPKFEDHVRWAVSGYPLVISGRTVTLEMTTRNVSDFRHVWRLPKLQESLVAHLAKIAPAGIAPRIEFYIGFDEIREKRNFVLATRDEPIGLPMELAMTEEWLETMCNVCHISEDALWKEFGGGKNHTLKFAPNELAQDFLSTDYVQKTDREGVAEPGDFYIDESRNEVVVRLLPAIYPHHIVGIFADGHVANISICGQSGRSGITIQKAKKLCEDAGMSDALVFDNGNDVFARIKGGDVIAHTRNIRQTRLTAGLHFASVLDPGPRGGFEIVSDNVPVTRQSKAQQIGAANGSQPIRSRKKRTPSAAGSRR
jgi:hypothetical protein